MFRSLAIISLLVSILFLGLACSGTSPVDLSPQVPDLKNADLDSHGLLGYYQITFDPATMTASAVPLRTQEAHFNVKSYVTPPACVDCIAINVISYTGQVLQTNIFLKNPTALSAHDVRGIMLSDNPSIWMTNADNFTSLFDNGGAVTVNPFRAFAKTDPQRTFASGATLNEPYNIHVASFSQALTIDFAVDISWPNRAKEPYQIGTPLATGEIDDLGQNTVPITVDVFAAGNDVNEVLINASSMGFGAELAMTFQSGNTWVLNFKNTPLAGVGIYACSLRASTTSSPLFLYQNFNLQVVPGTPPGVSLANDIQPIFDNYCTGCHGQGGSENLDLRPGFSWGQTVNQASQQSTVNRITAGNAGMSYLLAKIRGVHLNPPFNGKDKRMPWFAPQVTTAEETLIEQWINQGALNN